MKEKPSKTNKAGIVIEEGSKWEMVRYAGGNLSPLKVIGFAESYAVMRRKSSVPVVAHINTFGTEYIPK